MKDSLAIDKINSDTGARVNHDACLAQFVPRSSRIEQAIHAWLGARRQARANRHWHIAWNCKDLTSKLIAERTHERIRNRLIHTRDQHRRVDIRADHFVHAHRCLSGTGDVFLWEKYNLFGVSAAEHREFDARVTNLNRENGRL